MRILVMALFVCVPGWAQPAALPEGKGKAELERICGQCHGVNIVIKKPHTPEEWTAVVDEMIGRGAEGKDEEFERIVEYLSAHFGPKVNVNKAGAKELEKSLDISTADAEAIVRYRESTGSYKEWSDLGKVPGIDV